MDPVEGSLHCTELVESLSWTICCAYTIEGRGGFFRKHPPVPVPSGDRSKLGSVRPVGEIFPSL